MFEKRRILDSYERLDHAAWDLVKFYVNSILFIKNIGYQIAVAVINFSRKLGMVVDDRVRFQADLRVKIQKNPACGKRTNRNKTK